MMKHISFTKQVVFQVQFMNYMSHMLNFRVHRSKEMRIRDNIVSNVLAGVKIQKYRFRLMSTVAVMPCC